MKYCIGVDFGTLSARAVLIKVGTSEIVAEAVKDYSHGVMDEFLPDGKTRLGHDWALQHPMDYLEVLGETIPGVLACSGVTKEDVIGVGIDFTACTMLPVDKSGEALCEKEGFAGNPHAYVKLWKHHAAQGQANRLNEIATERGDTFLARYGGRISSEWMIPKIMQILDEDPGTYEQADRFMEAGDWVVLQLTGKEKRNSCAAGYKALWNKKDGYPPDDFFKALDPRLENLVEKKLSTDIHPLGTKAGEINSYAAKLTGLKKGTAVAVANVDAHAAVPAVGITEPGQLLMIMGTSTCHMVLGNEEKIVPGMCGVVEDGIMPGFFGFEAGQSCVGDHFDWFVNNCVTTEYKAQANAMAMNIHEFLREKAKRQKPGESGLVALDWWNGNRSVLVDADLTGLILGCTLLTRPEDIYRALIEATAYGTRMIIESFRDNGVEVHELFAAGGIAMKDDLMMQIYSDVTGMTIKLAKSPQSPALGSAMFGAVAAGKRKGGYNDIFEAAREMGGIQDKVYTPNPENVRIYEMLYGEYRILHDHFGRKGNDVMKRLKEIKKNAGR
ncbi:MAG: ribulokinase [Clostridia bacterium]